MGCCQLQSLLGAKFGLRGRKQMPYNSFEGYYCPVVKDNTGAMVYSKTSIKELGEPGKAGSDANWTLSWNRFEVSWELHKDDKLHASAQGDAVFPVEVQDPKSDFSATWIRPLKASWLRHPKVENPFPKNKPTYPKLKQFTPKTPDYTKYCSPQYLQNPEQFKGTIAESNPCYHTFTAKLVQHLDDKGITEGNFWSCALRSKARLYMRDLAAYSQESTQEKLTAEAQQQNKVMAGLQLSGAILGAVPWGSFGELDAATNTEVQTDVEEAEQQELEEESQNEESDTLSSARSSMAGSLEAPPEAEAAPATPPEQQENPGPRWGTLGKRGGAFSGSYNSLVAAGSASVHIAQIDQAQEAKTFRQSAPKGLNELLVPPYGKGEAPSAFHKAMAAAEWDDCLPVQAGLSKVMCDLFCVQDSVRAGTAAVLQSLGDSHQILMDNIQALLNYQTQYILWAMTQLPKAKTTLMQESIPSISDILTELTQAKPNQTTCFVNPFV